MPTVFLQKYPASIFTVQRVLIKEIKNPENIQAKG